MATAMRERYESFYLDGDLDMAGTSDSEDEGDIESFSDEEVDDFDTTVEQYRNGDDIQGIQWRRLNLSRERYRVTRLKNYKNYVNMSVSAEELEKECQAVDKGHTFFDFFRNTRRARASIVHFQLRNLLSSTSKHDIYINYKNCINHFNTVTNQVTPVLDVSGTRGTNVSGWGVVQVCTMCVDHGLVVAGGFHGDMVVKNLDSESDQAYNTRVTHSDNGITNGVELHRPCAAGLRIMTSSNDSAIRVFDANTFAETAKHEYDWAVNYATTSPQGAKMASVVGDHPVSLVIDPVTGKTVAELKGHKDFSFAAAWHPNGQVLATGNQDTTTRLWDLRYPGSSFATLKGRLGAVRSLRFSEDGQFLAMAEPADFVHVFDVAANYTQCQEIDLFGEIAGCAFSPDSSTFFVSVADVTYSSLLQFHRKRAYGLWGELV